MIPLGFDESGYPTEPYTEVAPSLFQADTTYSPLQLFDLGFGAVFDLCGIDRGDGVTYSGSPRRSACPSVRPRPRSTTCSTGSLIWRSDSVKARCRSRRR